jgi:hypothetical protein
MKEVIILGNGESRLKYDEYIKKYEYEIWGCNKAYLENYNFTRIGTVHIENANNALLYKKQNNLKYIVYYSYFLPECLSFSNYHGWSTGNELLSQALLENYKITLIGFDSLNNNSSDIYMKNVVIDNFNNQFKIILNNNNYKERIRVLI